MTIPRGTGAALALLLLAQSGITCAQENRSYVASPEAVANVERIRVATIEAEQAADRDIDHLFELYRQARSSGLTDEADTLAKKIVNAAIDSDGLDSKVTATALTNLGMLQLAQDENVSAIQNFSSAVDIVERVENRLSPDLILPLKGLGKAQMQAGHPDRAAAAWRRAVHVSHVNFGPHNYEQVETLYSIARLLYDVGASDEAYKIYKRISFLHKRESKKYREDDLPSG